MAPSWHTLFDLSGHHALVVGAGSGIGQAAAQGLAAFGAQVTCADLDAA
ncbi:MAG: 3-oxoacyl-ACP reductase, partial [Chloroflexi bacterium]